MGPKKSTGQTQITLREATPGLGSIAGNCWCFSVSPMVYIHPWHLTTWEVARLRLGLEPTNGLLQVQVVMLRLDSLRHFSSARLSAKRLALVSSGSHPSGCKHSALSLHLSPLHDAFRARTPAEATCTLRTVAVDKETPGPVMGGGRTNRAHLSWAGSEVLWLLFHLPSTWRQMQTMGNPWSQRSWFQSKQLSAPCGTRVNS